MDNKQTLQSHNNRLIQNSTNLSEVLDMINNMPEPEPNVQDKTVAITENGTITVTPDAEYDGLSSVTINTNAAEDLTEELTIQNEEITEQEAILANAANAFINKVISASGVPVNIYVQEEEPNDKNGIWIERVSSNPDIIDNISSLTFSNAPDTTYAQYQGPNTVLNGVIYVFGARDSNTDSTTIQSYKYDTVTGVTTKITGIKDYMMGGIAVGIDTNVYLFGGHTGAAQDYKTYVYDTIANTLTKKANSPQRFRYGRAITDGTYAYLVGIHEGITDTASSKIYKYDPINDTFTTITVPFYAANNCVAMIGDDIYVLGSFDASSSAIVSVGSPSPKSYKYNVKTNITTELADMPIIVKGITTVINDNIYCFSTSDNSAVMYNITSDTFKIINNYRDIMNRSSVHINPVGEKIYIHGGYKTKYGNIVMTIDIPVFDDTVKYNKDTLIIVRDVGGSLHQTKLLAFSDALTGFDDIKYYDKNSDTYDETSPVYYGNGDQWVKIKN